MEIIAHRAQDVKEPIPQRFGVEIDVRDAMGILALSHDAFANVQAPALGLWLDMEEANGMERPIYAINVKADGIERKLMEEFKQYPAIWNSTFFFDGSFLTMRRLKSLNVPVAERISEEEPYRGHSHIIWLDRWDWQDGEGPLMGGRQTATGKACYVPLIGPNGQHTEVYAVSPELHRPNCPPGYRQFWWRRFQEMGCAGICTDYWLECEDFFLKDTIEAIKGPILAAKYDIEEDGK